MSGRRRRGRPPSPEKAAATRQRILDATVDCLVERGWAGTSLPAVVARAQVSRGAQLYHFPTKAELVDATAAHLIERRRRGLLDALLALPERDRTLLAVVDVMWAQLHSDDFTAMVELALASRADAKAASPVARLITEADESVIALAAEQFPELAATEAARRTLQAGLALLIGLAVEDLFDPSRQAERQLVFVQFRGWLTDGLEPLAPPDR